MPFTAAPAPISPIAALDPSIVVAQQQAQQAQAYAAALRQQSMEPIDPNQMVSGRVVKVSPFQAMAKILEAGMAHYQQNNANQQQADIAARQGAMLQGLFGGGSPTPPATPSAPPDAASDALAQGAAAQPMTPDASGDGSMVNNGGTGPTVANAQRLGAVLASPDGSAPPPPAAPAAPPGGSSLRMPGMSPSQAYAMYTLDPAAYMTELYKRTNNQTDAYKAIVAAGIDPNSPQGQAMLTGAATNATAPKLTSVRQGGAVVDPQGNVVTAVPNMAPGTTPIIQNGKVVGVQPLPGNAGALQENAYAGAIGTAGAKPMQVWDPKANNGAGGMVYSTEAQVAGAAGAPPVAGAAPPVDPAVATMPPSIKAAYTAAAANPDQQLALLNTYKATLAHQNADFSSGAPNQNLAPPGTLPSALAPAQAPVQGPGGNPSLTLPPASPPAAPPASGPMAAAPPLGSVASADTAAQTSQQSLDQKWNTLSTANSNANTVIARLQTIQGLAPKAIVGAEQDRRDYLNGLLTLLPASLRPQSAVDAQTATDLLEKNSNQIVAQLGGGAASTDAFRSLLSAANPNAHMGQAAINDAADTLIGSQRMLQTKTALLLGAAKARDPASYAQIENQFDTAADPRVWQMAGMPAANVPGFLQRNGLQGAAAQDLLNKYLAAKKNGWIQNGPN